MGNRVICLFRQDFTLVEISATETEGTGMLTKLYGALEYLNIWSENKIRREFQRESDRIGCLVEPPNEEKDNLDLTELLSLANELFEKDNLDKLIAKLDAKIAELEAAEEATEQEINITQYENVEEADNVYLLEPYKTTISSDWVQDCMPRIGFSAKYIWEYEKALIKHIVENHNATINMALLHSLPDKQTSLLLGDLHLLIHCIANGGRELNKQIAQVKKRVSRRLQGFVKLQKYDQDDRYRLALYLYVIFLVLSVQEYTTEHSWGENMAEARNYLSYYLANGFLIGELNPPEVLSYAKDGIALSHPEDRQDAFNVLGCFALKSRGGRQLAYDTYLSWIKKEPIGLVCEFWPEEFTFGSHEDDWRRKEDSYEAVATMYNNYAYVCDSIAETYELRSAERKKFKKIAISNIVAALEKNPDPRYYCSYGLMLADMSTPEKPNQEILMQYEKALKESQRLQTSLPAMRLLCDAMIDDLLAMLLSSKQDFCQWAKETGLEHYNALNMRFMEYKVMLNDAQKDSNVSKEDKQNAWKSFFKLQNKLKSSNEETLELVLLLICQLAWNIKRFLRRNAYSTINYYTRDERKDAKTAAQRIPGKPIAYYTTIKTAVHLFDVLYRSNSTTTPKRIEPEDDEYGQGINCLTMMQAYYMNDPYEGLSFERGISGDTPNKNILFYRGDAWRFREDIFQKNFVFLKSFTDRMDNLPMWNRYGSDREIGSRDSNGCCIRFDPEFFDRINDTEVADTNGNLLVDKDDDYRLYRVVYLNLHGEIENAKNPKLDPNVKRCYRFIRQLLQYVNDVLCRFAEENPNDWRIAEVRSFVQSALNPVIFLFKDDEYADEQEYRLVASRSHKELENIRLLPGKSGEPDKYCINPYFQVCIDRVILGPNVEKPEHWFNYFRYQVAGMWRRALGPGADIPKFTVEKSSIHYHT